MVFKVIVDNGKPYEKGFNDELEVLSYLREVKRVAESGDYAYFDVMVLDSVGNDVSSYFYDKIEKKQNLKGGIN
jgi:hypothetical protein